MLPGTSNNNNSNHNRRYSLFNSPLTSSSSTISNLFGGDNSKSNGDSIKKNLIRRNTNHEMANHVCQRCKRFEVDLTNTSDSLSATDAELKASRQVISLLQRQLELFQVEKDGLEKLIVSQSSNCENTDSNRPPTDTSGVEQIMSDKDSVHNKLLKLIQTQLYAKDEEIVKLKSSLKEIQNEKEQLTLQTHMIEEDISKLKLENSLLKENLALRDQTIVSLSNEVFEQGNINELNKGVINSRRQSSVEALSNQRVNSHKTQRHIAKLIDTLEAYKTTNELLSNNVMKLTDRCATAEKKEIEARSQCHELEAKCCQIQSKLLSLLKEIEQSTQQNNEDQESSAEDRNQDVICSESVKLLIKRLLEDKSLDIPLSWKEGNRTRRGNCDEERTNLELECDELGFYIDPEDDSHSTNNSSPSGSSPRYAARCYESPPYAQLTTVEEGIEANETTVVNSEKMGKTSVRRQLSVDSTKNDEAKWRFHWDNFIKDFSKVDLTKSKDFKNLLRSGIPQEYRCKVWKALVELRIGKERLERGPDYYQNMLEPQSSTKKCLNPFVKQIELDLLRTLPNNRYFETLNSPGTVRLRRVLSAYSVHNPRVGYCQGMNRLAAAALLVLPEEEAFWCLVAIIDHIMPTGYYNDLWLAQVDSNVVMDFVSTKMPTLNDHFKKHDIELSLFAWFLTIFVDGTPPALFLRLWDCFLFEGDKVLFRVALALLKRFENQLLRLNNSVAINNFLRLSVNAKMDIDSFYQIAFEWLNPLPGRILRSKRHQQFQLVRTGLRSGGAGSSMTMSPDDNSIEDKYAKVTDDSPNEDSSIISI